MSQKSTSIVVAPFCDDPHHLWFSPGRSSKLRQVEHFLAKCSFNLYRVNTCPLTSDPYSSNTILACTQYNPILRYLELLRGLPYLLNLFKGKYLSYLWIYNCRFQESLVSLFILLLLRPRKICIEIEDFPLARPQNSGLIGVLDFVSLAFFSLLASRVYVVNSTVAELMKNCLFCNPSKIRPLYPALTSDYIRSIYRREPPFTSNHVKILYAGGYGIEKGVYALIHAFLHLNNPSYRLLLAGPAPAGLVQEFCHIPTVVFLGYLPYKLLCEAYASADIIVSPHDVTDRSSHIFPFKLLEIFASGALPLVTPMPGMSIFNIPDCCIFQGQDDLCSKFITAPQIYASNKELLISNARRLSTKFSQEVLLNDFIRSLP